MRVELPLVVVGHAVAATERGIGVGQGGQPLVRRIVGGGVGLEDETYPPFPLPCEGRGSRGGQVHAQIRRCGVVALLPRGDGAVERGAAKIQREAALRVGRCAGERGAQAHRYAGDRAVGVHDRTGDRVRPERERQQPGREEERGGKEKKTAYNMTASHHHQDEGSNNARSCVGER